MWMPQQQESKQNHQQPSNMVPVSDVGLNSSNYIQQEWQTQLPSNYGNYQQQQNMQPRQSQQIQAPNPNLYNQSFQNNWQTQPLQVPSPLPPQYSEYSQQSLQQQISNNMYIKQQSQQIQNNQLQQQQKAPYQKSTLQTSSYFEQQPLNIPTYSEASKTEQNVVNPDESIIKNNNETSLESKLSINNNVPKLENFFDQNVKKDGEGVDGWDDWDWADPSNQKEVSNPTLTGNSSVISANPVQSKNKEEQRIQSQFNQFMPDKTQNIDNQIEEHKVQPSYETTLRDEENKSQNNRNRIPLRNVINDNWQWDSDEYREKNKSLDKEENKNVDVYNNEGSYSTNNDFYSSNTPIQIGHEKDQNIEEIEANQQNQKLLQQSFNNHMESFDNNQATQNTVGTSSVYLTQAKPVSQPFKQFASPPAQNTSILFNDMQELDISTIPPPQSNSDQYGSQEENVIESAVIELPPPPLTHQKQTSSNPFKRTGPPQHGRAGALIPPPFNSNLHSNSNQLVSEIPQFYNPPPPEEFQNSRQNSISSVQENQEILSPENSEIINDNQDSLQTTTDRNRYMQMSHLSGDGSEFPNLNRQPTVQKREKQNDNEQNNNENDAFPPPGLSRLVLGQPKTENSSVSIPTMTQNISTNYIPPNFDRMIPGTELTASSTLNLERQADGQDTIPSPISAFTNVQTASAEVDVEIISDRNLYQVPGKSENNEDQQSQIYLPSMTSNNTGINSQHQKERFVTGVEDDYLFTQTNTSQRELELDGENLEDEQQLQNQQQKNSKNVGNFQVELDLPSSRDEPIEGANTHDLVIQKATIKSNEIETTNRTQERMVLSLPSTANDESDDKSDKQKATRRGSRNFNDKSSRKNNDIEEHVDYKTVEDKKTDRYYSEESEDNSSDNTEKKRLYREDSNKNSREKYKTTKVRKEKPISGNSNKYRESAREYRNVKNERSDDDRNDTERIRRKNNNSKHPRERYEKEREERKSERNRGQRPKRYENDSRYEIEGSRYYRGDSDHNTYESGFRRDEKDRRYKKRDEKEERIDYNANESRRKDRRREKGNDRTDYKYEDRKDKHRRDKKDKSSRSDYDDDYRKGSSSRNASEREAMRGRDKDRFSQMYGYSNVYGYDPYTYYQQQQQYYEQLRRTNPQAYMEWYNKYYSENAGQLHPDMMGAVNTNSISVTTGGDGRESVHSGRSSANNDKDRTDMSLTIGDSGSLTQELHRLTPLKFTNDHAIVSLSAGTMAFVKPRYMQKNGSKIVKIVKIGCNDSTHRLFQAFPGPLVRGITHKKTIIEFCEDQIRLGPNLMQKNLSRQNSMSSLNSLSSSNRASFVLMWNLLILLLRQNGVVIGTDIAELLIRNQKEFPYENNSNASKKSLYSENSNYRDDITQNENTSKSEDSDTGNEENSDNEDHLTKKMKNMKLNSKENNKHKLMENEITDKFRNYLLYGNINEALEWATNNNLWGHALFLASKVDRRLYANVLMKFANKLPFNDPLQTLYQLMSYKTPASVTSVQDEKWGDWRPHLAMILSNTSQRPDLDRKSITTLGDSLHNRGDHFGAHFCFLMAQVGFGTYFNLAKEHETSYMLNSQSAVRLVLLGSPFNKNFREFAYNEAIMMTEIYEYACSLNDDKFSIPELQPYKYLLASRMLDYGFQMKALMYMEQISLHIQMDSSRYDMSFISRVCDFADRLKFYDPTIEKTLDNLDPSDPKFAEIIDHFENQKWIQNLQNILGDYKPNVIAFNQPIKPSQNSSSGINVPSGQNQNKQYEQQNDGVIDQFRAINQQIYELNSQYNNNSGFSLVTNSHNEQTQNLSQVNNNETFDAGYYDQNKIQDNVQSSGEENNNQNQYQHQSQFNQGMGSFVVQDNSMSIPQPQQNFINNQNYSYNNWNQTTDQTSPDEVSRPSITLPNSKFNQKQAYEDENANNDGASTNASEKSKEVKSTSKEQRKSTGEKPDLKSLSKSSSQNSGWFEGIWNKLSLKPKNQMILPDDKNPTIVWDPDTKRWVNTDGEETTTESFKPPPKMSDIRPGVSITPNNSLNMQNQQLSEIQQQEFQIGQQEEQFRNYDQNQLQFNSSLSTYQEQQQQSQFSQPSYVNNVPANSVQTDIHSVNNNVLLNTTNLNVNKSSAVETHKVPNLQSNMFKMQRNRTLKKSYVDVFNPSGAPSPKPAEPILAPAMPTIVPQSGFFIPTPVANNNENYQLQQEEGAPQFYNPNQFGSYQQQ